MHQPASNRSRTAWSLERRPSPIEATSFEGAFPMVTRSRSIARILDRPPSLTSSDGWSTLCTPTGTNLPERVGTCDSPTRNITTSGGPDREGQLVASGRVDVTGGDMGTQFVRERYEILSVLGHGGQGKVARALDHQHDRVVALKIPRGRLRVRTPQPPPGGADAAQPAAAFRPSDRP